MTYRRLCVLSKSTGVPESTLRAACASGELVGLKVAGAWHTTLEYYNAWIEAQGSRGGDVRTAAEREMAARGQGQGKGRQGTGEGNQTGSEDSPSPKARKRKRQKLRIVWDISDAVRPAQAMASRVARSVP